MRTALLLGVVISCQSICAAAPIKFTYEGTASGRLDSNRFFDEHFLISGLGDTSNLYVAPSGAKMIDFELANVFIESLGTLEFTTPIRSFLVAGGIDESMAGIGVVEPGMDLVFSGNHTELQSWDGLTSIGPLTGLGRVFQWDLSDNPVMTSAGRLRLNSAFTDITFQAVVAPEPSTLALLAIVGCAATGYRRRR